MALLSSSASVVPLLVPQASTWWLNSNVGYYQGVSMAEIEGLVRALREGDDAAKLAAARSLHPLVQRNASDRVLFAEAGGIPPIVELLRDGSADAKQQAARAIGHLAFGNAAANKVAIAEHGGIPPLVELLRDGSADAKEQAVRAIGHLAFGNAANKALIAEAGGIPPLVELLRDGSADAKQQAANALWYLASTNDANAVEIAAAVGLEALVQLARRGRVTVNNQWILTHASLPAKRKAALVVAALLRGRVPVDARSRADVQDVIRAVIGPYL